MVATPGRWALAGGIVVLAGAAGAMVALAGGALGVGCITAESESTACDAGAAKALSSFCNALSTADCTPAIVTACYGQPSTANTSKCIDAAQASCEKAYGQPSPCNPGCLSLDGEYASACESAHSTLYASASLTVADYASATSACQAVLNKGCLMGATCDSGSDCDLGAGLVCVVQGAATGTCQVPSIAMSGDPCSNDPTAQCVNATYCGDAGTCVPDNDAGCRGGKSKCTCDDVTSPCYDDVILHVIFPDAGDAGEVFDVNGLRCVGGACSAKLEDGASCADGGDDACLGGFCVGNVCQSVYTFAPGTPATSLAPGCAYFGVP